ncbi:HDOD domain-containing protein [Candidatus Nitrotoga sp. BS]|uniref:HDOD domain-containing protein n=1 Tax=Candidatus Nitrotoga sp. BS TaxID=2890408 RepID=UPI001EF1E9E0|nr:HDOD domain-containing protein [Candidatus Nitrotoga sp. BS]CAH1199683.1 HDOD domain-containing protein [Candidatus Nitrotoga sp. BS]
MSDTQQDSRPAPVDSLFESAILDIGIPPCPAVLDRFMAEMGKDEPDFQRLAGIIGTDVALSASLIKTANSPYFGMRQRVRSANEALTVLGLKASSHTVAGIILRNSFPNVSNLERFWDASARIARLSAWLAQDLKLRDLHVNDAYTFGLFRDCGIPVLLGYFPEYSKALAEANNDSERCFIEVEETEIPTNHAMIGCILAQSWWLPEELCLGIRNHHELAKIESAHSDLPMLSRKLIATSQLAEHLVQKKLGLSITQEWTKLGVACLQLLEVDEERLEILYAEAPTTEMAD